MISLTLLNLFDPERSFFMTYYPIIRETFDVLPVSVITSVVFVFDSIFGFTCLTIPLISFYVIACYVESLYEEWESSSKNEQFLRMIWQRYESILHLVDRANELYGAVINGFNSYIILICCMTVFYALGLFQRSLILFLNVIIFFIIKFGYIVRFSWFMSRLYFSKDKLKKSIDRDRMVFIMHSSWCVFIRIFTVSFRFVF